MVVRLPGMWIAAAVSSVRLARSKRTTNAESGGCSVIGPLPSAPGVPRRWKFIRTGEK